MRIQLGIFKYLNRFSILMRSTNGDHLKKMRAGIGPCRLLVVLTQEQDSFLEVEVSKRGVFTKQDVIRQLIDDERVPLEGYIWMNK